MTIGDVLATLVIMTQMEPVVIAGGVALVVAGAASYYLYVGYWREDGAVQPRDYLARGRTTRMVWEFECPVDGGDFSRQANEAGQVVESAQQHTRDAHGEMPTREEVEPYVIGPG